MGPLSYLRSVYDVSTLDTRFATPSSVPFRTAQEIRDDPAVSKDHAASIKASATPSRWTSLEYIGYAIFLAWAIPGMFVIGYSVSQRMIALLPVQVGEHRANALQLPIRGTQNMNRSSRRAGSPAAKW